MSQPNLDLSALIGSRICHDLISPVGAIANGLELLGLAGVPDGPEMSLVADSAAHASARLRFFRIAFGLSSEGQGLPSGELAEVLSGLYRGKIACEWDIAEPLPRRLAQASFLGILCAEQAIPHGGTLRVSGGAGRVRITATGARLTLLPEHWAWLGAAQDAGHLVHLPAAQVQFALLPALLAELGRTPEIDCGDALSLAF
ncbi:histidine phosphotransferase family protein [Roseovarius aquimarinus]|uniref:Histidine phosphotransferase family protein n=1 Tax=Roseovarius aquimarinus TaxID=1229156 RepID=A0ABW7I5A4_9RHOB